MEHQASGTLSVEVSWSAVTPQARGVRGSAGLRLSVWSVSPISMKTSVAQSSQKQSHTGVRFFPVLKVSLQKPKVVFDSQDLHNMGNFW